MAVRITVFLRNTPERLDAKAIQEGLSPVDWLTLGEYVGLEEDEVEALMDGLRWRDDPLGFESEGQRPVRVEHHAKPETVKALVEELDQSDRLKIPRRVRRHLGGVTSVVSFDMEFSQWGTMYETVAMQAAYWLAEEFDGLILSNDDQWYDHDANRWNPIRDHR